MKGLMMNYQLTLVHILERSVKLFSDREIVSRVLDGSLYRYTYADFYRRARLLAAALSNFGIKKGDRIGSLMWNHYIHLETYFGVPVSGGVLHTVNVRLNPDDIVYIINQAEDRVLIVDNDLLPLLKEIENRLNVEKIIINTFSDISPNNYTSYEQFISYYSSYESYPLIDESDAAVICYSSGTTGLPKGVVYSHRALVLHSLAGALPDVLNVKRKDAVAPIVPMFHVNAWGLPFIMTMLGCKQVYPGHHLDAANLLDLFNREKVTLAAGVPTVWINVMEEVEKDKGMYKFPDNFTVVVGGSAPSEDLLNRLMNAGCSIKHAWGMTETTPLATINSSENIIGDVAEKKKYTHLTKQGTPIPFVEIRVVNEDGVITWDGKSMGEIQVRGPWISSGYYRAKTVRWELDEGWLCTGDIATIDSDGSVKLVDRTKDLIKSGGEWISSVELENELMGHGAVKEAAVIAVEDAKWEERPLAVIVFKEGKEATAEELKEYLKPKFVSWWIPDSFVFVDKIPRTSSGKFYKKELRKNIGKYLQ